MSVGPSPCDKWVVPSAVAALDGAALPRLCGARWNDFKRDPVFTIEARLGARARRTKTVLKSRATARAVKAERRSSKARVAHCATQVGLLRAGRDDKVVLRARRRAGRADNVGACSGWDRLERCAVAGRNGEARSLTVQSIRSVSPYRARHANPRVGRVRHEPFARLALWMEQALGRSVLGSMRRLVRQRWAAHAACWCVVGLKELPGGAKQESG